jgi:hypothetical protein
MHFDKFSFGTLRIDGSTYEQDVVIDRGEPRKRKKAPSRRFRDEFGHTPLSVEEKIPWKCHRLVIGTGAYGRSPVYEGSETEAERRHVLVIVPTSEALRLIEKECSRQRQSPRDQLMSSKTLSQLRGVLVSPIRSNARCWGLRRSGTENRVKDS